jgi:hypothetical protein
MRAFCDACWAKVPAELKVRLIRMIKGGFVVAFEEARGTLGHPPLPEPPPRRGKAAIAAAQQTDQAAEAVTV